MPNGTYGGVRGRKMKVGRKLLRFPPTRLLFFVGFMAFFRLKSRRLMFFNFMKTCYVAFFITFANVFQGL